MALPQKNDVHNYHAKTQIQYLEHYRTDYNDNTQLLDLYRFDFLTLYLKKKFQCCYLLKK